MCDFAHQAVLTLGAEEDGSDQQLTAIVKDYEGKGLKVRRARRLSRLWQGPPLPPRVLGSRAAGGAAALPWLEADAPWLCGRSFAL
eukprot:COSAG01_NODE_565_length_15436_cov_64.116581_15_plen_86_part_00